MPYVTTWLLALWAIAVTYFDARFRRIPNLLSLGAWGLAASVLIGKGASLTGAPTGSATMAAGVALLLTLPGYLTNRLGAGDVKYFAAIGLLTSLPMTLITFVIAALTGGLIVFLWAVLPSLAPMLPGRLVSRLSPNILHWALIPIRERRMPYGALLSLGLIVSIWMERAS
jgi:prepilin peptidase CpaA